MTELDRAAIAMSPDAIVDILATVRTMSVATIGADGWPHVVAMWFAVHDGLITFMTYRRSQKCRNLAHDDRVTCLVEAGEQYEELRGVQIRGRATESPRKHGWQQRAPWPRATRNCPSIQGTWPVKRDHGSSMR
ncbi:MAG: pyridoxamine 5'-phosphate oxidase family protein [Mycobacterium sp.]